MNRRRRAARLTLVGALAATGALNGSTTAVVAETPPAAAVVPVEPARLVDTRSAPGYLTIDGQLQGIGQRPAGSVLDVPVLGRGGVPASEVGAVILNVTAVGPVAPGHLIVFPCGTEPPNASNVNYLADQVVPNAVIAKLGNDGRVCIYTLAATDLVVDISAYTPVGAGVEPLAPARLVETRDVPGWDTIDGQLRGIGQRPAGSVLEIPVVGRGGVPDSDVSAVLLNVTAVTAAEPGYLTVFPCGTEPPNASNVNYTASQTTANAVMAKLGAGDKVCVYTLAAVDLVVDVNGYTTTASGAHSLTPARLVETRDVPGWDTIDSQLRGIGQRAADSVLVVQVLGRGGVPGGGVGAVMLNVTAVGATGPGFLTVYPCGTTPPVASNVNYETSQTVPNAVLAKVGLAGAVCIYTRAAADLVVDVTGWFPGSDPPQTGTGFIQVTTGSFHACALRADHTAACWGGANYPVTPPADRFITLSSGDTHTCGLRLDNSMVCWGQDAPINPLSWQAKPGTFIAIATSFGTNCGVRIDRTAICWYAYNDQSPWAGPTEFASPGPFVTAYEDSNRRGCGLRPDGTAACWVFTAPVGVVPQTQLLDVAPGPFVHVPDGLFRNCGLRADGTSACWAYLGYAFDNHAMHPQPAPTGSFVELRQTGNAWGDSVCGLRSDGDIVCSNAEYSSHGGGGTLLDHVSESTVGGPFTTFDVSVDFGCGIRPDRSLECWGNNNVGQATPPAG